MPPPSTTNAKPYSKDIPKMSNQSSGWKMTVLLLAAMMALFAYGLKKMDNFNFFKYSKVTHRLYGV